MVPALSQSPKEYGDRYASLTNDATTSVFGVAPKNEKSEKRPRNSPIRNPFSINRGLRQDDASADRGEGRDDNESERDVAAQQDRRADADKNDGHLSFEEEAIECSLASRRGAQHVATKKTHDSISHHGVDRVYIETTSVSASRLSVTETSITPKAENVTKDKKKASSLPEVNDEGEAYVHAGIHMNVSDFRTFILATSSSESCDGSEYLRELIHVGKLSDCTGDAGAVHGRTSLIRQLEEQVQALDFRREEENIEQKQMKLEYLRQLETLKEERDCALFVKNETEAKLTEEIQEIQTQRTQELEQLKIAHTEEMTSMKMKLVVETERMYNEKLQSLSKENEEKLERILREHEIALKELRKEAAPTKPEKSGPELNETSDEATVSKEKENNENLWKFDRDELQKRLEASETEVASLKKELRTTMNALKDTVIKKKLVEHRLESVEASKAKTDEDSSISLRSLQSRQGEGEDDSIASLSPSKQLNSSFEAGQMWFLHNKVVSHTASEETVRQNHLSQEIESSGLYIRDVASHLVATNGESKPKIELLEEAKDCQGEELATRKNELNKTKLRLAKTEVELNRKMKLLNEARDSMEQQQELMHPDQRDIKISELEEQLAQFQRTENRHDRGAVFEVRQRFLKSFETQLQEKESEVVQMERRLSDSEQVKQSLRASQKELQAKLVSLEKTKKQVEDEMQKRLQECQREHELMQEQLLREKEFIKAHKAKEEDLESKVNKLEKALKDATRSKEEKQEQYGDLESRYTALQKEERELRSELEFVEKSSGKTRRELEATLKQSENARSDLEQRNTELEKMCKNFESQVKEKDETIMSLKKGIDDLKKKEESLQITVDGLVEKNHSLRGSCLQMKEEVENLIDLKKNLQLDLEKSVSHSDELKQSIERLQRELRGKEMTMLEQQRTISSLSSFQQVSEKTRKDQEEKLKQSESDISQLKQCNAQVSQELNELKSLLQDRKEALDLLQKEKMDLLELKKSLQCSEDDLKRKNKDLHELVEEMEEEIEDLTNKRQQLQSEVDSCWSAKGLLEASVQKLESTLAERERITSEQRMSIAQLQSERDEGKSLLRRLQDESRGQKEEDGDTISSLENKLNKAKDVVLQYKETVEELDEEITALRDRINTLETEAAAKSAFCGGLFPL